MNIITSLIDVLITAISGDNTLINWCNTNYSTPPTIYKGIDLRQPPNEDEYPILHIFPSRKNVGYDLAEKVHAIGLVTGLVNTTINTTTTGDSVVIKEYQGIDDTESFRKLIEDVIVDNVPTDSWVDSLDISYEIIEAFPFFLSFNLFEITEKYCQGDNVFT